MKGCLKHLQLQGAPSPRKTVVFESQSLEQVFVADEWDRTPTEPSKKLSYQDLLELKEIQLSLPRANQPADLLTGRSGSHYLSGVPIGLLPLLPESTPSTPTSPSPKRMSSPMSPSWASFSPNSRQCPLPTSPPPGGVDALLHPTNLSHLPPARTEPARQKPRFAFLPLLDSNPASRSRSPSPDPSDTDPPTPTLTYASLDSSPLSRASSCSCSPEPPFFQLPPPRRRPGVQDPADDSQLSDNDGGVYFGISSKLGNMHVGTPMPPYGYPSRPPLMKFVPPPPLPPPPAPKATRKRNVIYVNDMEIELDDDDEEESRECSTPPAVPHQQLSRSPPTARLPSIPAPRSPPPLRWQSPPNESPLSGLHAPVRFKRQVPSTKGDCSSPILSASPPSPRARRGSVCSGKVKGMPSPRSSPILMPRA